ncbi:response regulator transcription factor [Lentibacillus sp. N15]|uniref:response regulator transcription factor n=1 Tax=Lentibacillus songyuanensis TaxID=3136161 RepID=UPI0031BB6C82
MSLTLNHQMNTVFHHGLGLVRKYQQPILEEWQNILVNLRKAGKRSEKNAEDTITFFSTYLFKPGAQKDNSKTEVSFQSNPFILSLLENSVHHVIQKQTKQNHQNYQAVQYLFSTISEQILAQPYLDPFSIDAFLKQLVLSQQFPIEWAAMVIQKEQTFIVEKGFHYETNDLLLGITDKQANSIYALSELLLSQMTPEQRQNRTVIPIPYVDGTILICVKQQNTSQTIPFITYALEIFQKGKETLKVTMQEQQWKDSVILFHESIMRSQSLDEATENITAGFVHYLPFKRCALFSYSMNDQMSFGLFGHQIDNKAIQNITEDLDNLPVIQNSLRALEMFGNNLQFLQPIYIKDAKAGFPEQYVQQFQLCSVVIAPIFTSSSNKLLGAAILDQGPGHYFKVGEETFSALIKFGKSAGEILSRFMEDKSLKNISALHLSPREIDVLELMADGASTSEAANKLNLSEYTVRDYVSAIMQKMEARNRTEAVARAIRDGLI